MSFDFDLLMLLVFKFLLKYDKLAHVRMKKSILWMNHRSSGVLSNESQRISRMRRFNGFFFSSVSEASGDNSVDSGCDRLFDSTVAGSLSIAMMVVVVIPNRSRPRPQHVGFEIFSQWIYRAICLISNGQDRI